MRESVPPKPRTKSFPRASLSDFPLVLPDIELPDAQYKPYQSIEDASDKGDKEEEEEEEKLDYNIEWKVLIRKEPIISDIISRQDFRFATLYKKAKKKA